MNEIKDIDVDELKRIQIDILDYFDAFCKKNDLKYWLDYGTLLGAIRHKGYIPWDDDIDIGMLREDYSKAEKLFNIQSNGKIVFKTPQNDKTYRYPFGKLIRTDTVLDEYGNKGIRTGVYIDVFPYDNASNNVRNTEKMFKRRDVLGRIRRLQLPMRDGLSMPKRVLFGCLSSLMKMIPRNTVNRAIDRNAKKYEKEETSSRVGSFTDTYTDVYTTKQLLVPKQLFQKLSVAEFEHKYYPVPTDYDCWLKCLYGDYMTLPPMDKRVAHHVFEAHYII